jgi:hypothetical protein
VDAVPEYEAKCINVAASDDAEFTAQSEKLLSAEDYAPKIISRRAVSVTRAVC